MDKKDKKELGRHDWSGKPGLGVTFSCGIFEWIKPVGGGGLKKSKIKIRVCGYASYPDQVYRLAEKFCDMLDAGKDPGVKQVWASDAKWIRFVRG